MSLYPFIANPYAVGGVCFPCSGISPARSRTTLYMPHCLTLLFLVLTVFLPSGAARADDSIGVVSRSQWSVGASATVGHLLHAGPFNKEILHSFGVGHYDVSLQWQASPTTSDPYDRAWRRPTLKAGLACTDFSHVDVYRPTTPYRSKIGQLWTLYGGVQYEVLRSSRFSMRADLANGIGYCANPYDPNRNADNEVIGSTLSIYVSLGLQAQYRFSRRWRATLGIDFKHYSNATLDRPNLGANVIGPTLGLVYDITPATTDKHHTPPQQEDAAHPCGPDLRENKDMKLFYIDFNAALGLKALNERFNLFRKKHNPIYGFANTSLAAMYRYHIGHASGAALDYTYADYVYRIRHYDRLSEQQQRKYSPHIWGISLRHEMFYKSFSVNVGLGFYLYNHTGYVAKTNEGHIYQNVALRYNLPFWQQRLYIGYNIKAHQFQKVNSFHLQLGLRIH